MVKPLWALTGIALLGTAGAVGAVVIASPGGEEEAVPQVATTSPDAIIASHAAVESSPGAIPLPFAAPTERPIPKPLEVACNSNRENTVGGQVYQWGDLLLGVPDGSRVVVGRGDPHLVELVAPELDGGAQSNLVIDSKNGETVSDKVEDKHRAEIQAVVASTIICPFDRASAPWPYSAIPPTVPEERRFPGFVILPPDPAAGIEISWGVSEGGIGAFLEIRSARSQMFLSEYEGAQYTPGTVHPEDREAFERFAQSVRICSDNEPC